MTAIELPEYNDALIERIMTDQASPLDHFVYNNEPAGIEDEQLFRTQLQKALDQAYQLGRQDGVSLPWGTTNENC